MKHVVFAEEEGKTNLETITFPELRDLYLYNFSNLPTFYSGGSGEEMFSNENLETAIQPLFNEKALFPKLEELVLWEISSVCLVTSSIAMGLVGLKRLEVRDCVGMKHLFVAGEGGETNIETITFPQLSSLYLEGLPNLTTVYSEMGSNENLDSAATQPLFSENVSFPKLEELELCGISNLTEIWSHKFQEMSFCNLTSLTIRKCESLKHVFPSFAALYVNKVEYLSIHACEEVETIIGDEITNATQHVDAATIMFPKLTRIRLERLPKVKCFYPREHAIECPVLTSIDVNDCGKLNAFDFLSFPQKQGDNLFEKVVSKLENLSIRSIDLMNILTLYGHFPPHLFSSLTTLDIVEFHGGSVVFPSEFLSIIYNQLQVFRVHNCAFQEIFPCEGEVIDHVSDYELLPQLTFLQLKKLPELSYICKHDQYSSLILNILDGLQHIKVEECPRLTNLVPLSVSFRSLKFLIVKDCGGLTSLIQPSTTTSLEQLRMLTISGCEMMEKVIGYDDEELSRGDNEIILPNLWKLELVELPGLTNFCSSPSYTFNFPELSDVSVRECPNMKTFCRGITIAPELNKIEYDKDGELWERWGGELNTTVQQIFAEMEAKILGTSTLSEPDDYIESNIGIDTCEEVAEEEKQGSVCVKATVPDTREKGKGKGKGKEPEVSEEVVEHSRNFQDITHHSDASSSKLSNHSEEFQRLIMSTSWNTQEAEIHGKAAEPRKATEISEELVDIPAQHAVPSSSRLSSPISSSKNVSDDPTIEGQVREKSANLMVRELPPLLPSTPLTNHIAAVSQVPENSARAQNDATNAEKAANTFEEGSLASQQVVASSEETNPPAETSLSLSTELEVWRSTSKIESEATDPRKAGETLNHSEMESPARTCSSICFIPLLYTAGFAPPSKFSNHSEEVPRSTATVESEATDPKKGSEIDEEVLQGVKLADICDKAQEQLHPPISNTLQVTSQQKDRIHVMSAEKVNDEPIREADIGETSHCLETEPETRIVASSSYEESFRGLRESFQVLEAQPMSRVSAEQVRFMEEASEWFCGYIKQAREYLEQKELISGLELKIDDMEAQLQVLKEKKRVAEEKKNVASRVAKFG